MSHGIDDGVVRRAPLFAAASSKTARLVAAEATIRQWRPGDTLWLEGQAADGLHIVLEGRVRIIRSRDGRQFVIHHEGAGATLGEVPLFDGGAYPASAVAASRVRCLFVPAATLHRALAEDAALSRALIASLAGRVRQVVGRLKDATVGTVRSRLAAHILARATVSRSPSFTLAGTQAQVAEDLGTVREVLARELAALRAAGVIRPAGRGRFELLDEAALEAMTRD